jgi:hypothetical protein
LRNLDQAEYTGIRQARNQLINYHNHMADQESNLDKKQWHKEEAIRLADDSQWNLLIEKV